jgi:[ribosomal protein S5]-alanine N-acetyltransferase
MDGMGVTLAEWSEGDAGWYVSHNGDPDMRRFTTTPATITAADFHHGLAALRADPAEAGFRVELDGVPAGGITASLAEGVVSLSYWVAPWARGRGVASAALAAMCAWAAGHWDVTRFTLWTHADNIGSQKAARNAGFVHTHDGTRDVGGAVWAVRWFQRDVADFVAVRRRPNP